MKIHKTCSTAFALAALLLSSSALAQESTTAEKTITITKRKGKVGDKFKFSSKSLAKNEIDYFNADGAKLVTMNQKQIQSDVCELTVLAVDGNGRATKIEVHCVDKRMKQEQSIGKGFEKIATLVGKTVILERTKSDVKVTAKDNSELLDSQVQEALSMYKGHVSPEPSTSPADLIPDRPLKVGETFKTDKAIKYLGGETPDAAHKSATLEYKLKGQKKVNGQECAIFETKQVLTIEPAPGLTLKVTQTGETAISINGKDLVQQIIKGPCKMTGTIVIPKNQQKMTIKGLGTWDTDINIMATFAAPTQEKPAEKPAKEESEDESF